MEPPKYRTVVHTYNNGITHYIVEKIYHDPYRSYYYTSDKLHYITWKSYPTLSEAIKEKDNLMAQHNKEQEELNGWKLKTKKVIG